MIKSEIKAEKSKIYFNENYAAHYKMDGWVKGSWT